MKKFVSKNQILLFYFLILLQFVSSEIVKYTLVVKYIEGYPDGVLSRHILSVNGSLPGPTLEAFIGDTLEVTVLNEIQNGQNLTLHWHGLHQRNSVFEDGVGMITQCPLAAGHSQTYRFELTQAGTFWYHSHFRSQYTEGLFGPLIVHRKENEVYNYYGEATLVLSDWYHRPASENEAWYNSQIAFGQPPKIDSVLVNGMSRYSCGVAIKQNLTCRSQRQLRQVIRIQREKVYRLRLINAAARTPMLFSISENNLEVIEADGVDVVSFITKIIPISEGMRYSVLVQCPANSTNGSRYLIRSNWNPLQADLLEEGVENINTVAHAMNSNGTAILECTDEDLSGHKDKVEMTTERYGWGGIFQGEIPAIDTEPEEGDSVLDQMNLQPLDGIPAPDVIDEEYTVTVTFWEGLEDDVRWPGLNYTSFTYPEDEPLLQKVISGEPLTNKMLSINIQLGRVVQLVINNYPFENPHPFHLHGHSFWVMGIGKAGDGPYNPEKHQLTRFGPKRDTFMVETQSWAVIRFVADNPGVWLFHCHLDWHAIGGMAMAFIEGEEELKERFPPTEEYRKVCGYLNV